MYAAVEMSDILHDLPADDNDDDDDDGDDGLDQLTVECSHRQFPLVYYLQLDSHTE